MSETKWTPGPWAAKFRGDGSCYISMGDSESEAHKMFNVCLEKDYSNDEFDARLIAAAPELYSVVNGFRWKLHTYVSVYPGDKELRRLLDECDAALAKARGEQP